MSTAELSDHAIEAAGRGWHVFPVNGKIPATPNGVKDATTDLQTIARWFDREGHTGLAVATGKPSGMWVLDVDGDQGEESLRRLQAEHGKLPPTLTTGTHRGWHLFFQMPPDRDIRNSAGKIAPGLDVRGTGGYVVLPPSPHPDAGAYHYVRKGDVTVALGWLLELVTETRRTAEPIPEAIPEGSRNQTLTSAAGTMRRRGMSAEAIRLALQEENRLRCNPPLPEGEVNGIARSVSQYAPEEQRSKTLSKARSGTYNLRALASYDSKPVSWLWEGRVAYGKLNAIVGDPDLGKSTATLDLAARVSVGDPMPDGSDA